MKNLPANAGDLRDASSILGSGRSLGEGNYNPLQYACLGNPMDREAWWARVYRVARVRHNFVTKEQQTFIRTDLISPSKVLYISEVDNKFC